MLNEAKKREDLHLFIYDDMVELLAEGTRKEVCENLLVQEVILWFPETKVLLLGFLAYNY